MASHPSEPVARRPIAPAHPVPASREVALAPSPPVPQKPEKQGNSLIEFSTIASEDPNADVIFGDVPTQCKCPHCDRSVVTFLEYEASWVSWVLACVVWVSLGWMAMWVLPLLWPAFKDVVHHCPRCLNVIERKSRIALPTFKTEVMTVKIGSCAVVLARKYVAILVGLLVLIITVYSLRSTVQMHTAHEEHKGPPSMLSWEDFLFDCGPRTSLSHRPSVSHTFEERYRRRTFKWQGEVRFIREGFDIFFVKTKNVAMVQMYPPRYKTRRGDHPDIALLFGEERNREVAQLEPGDWVEFEATMSAFGVRDNPQVMILWQVAKAPRPDPLSSSAGADHHRSEPLDPVALDGEAPADELEGRGGAGGAVGAGGGAAIADAPPAAKTGGASTMDKAISGAEDAAAAAGGVAITDAPPVAKNGGASAVDKAISGAEDAAAAAGGDGTQVDAATAGEGGVAASP